MNIENILSSTVEDYIENGKAKEIFEKSVDKCFSDLITNMFGYASAGRKKIEEAIFDKIELSTKNIDIPSYNKMVSKIIKDKLSDVISTDLEHEIIKNVHDITKIFRDKNVKLSKIIETYIEFKNDELESDDIVEHMRVEIETTPYNYTNIKFFNKEEENATRFSTLSTRYKPSSEYGITISKQMEVFHVDLERSHGNTLITSKYGFDKFLFALYTNSCKIELDIEDGYEFDCGAEYD